MQTMVDIPNSGWPLPVSIRTDRWAPRIILTVVLVIALSTIYFGLTSLEKLSPPEDAIYNRFLMTEGRQLLGVYSSKDSNNCRLAIAGGWKKGKEDEYLRFQILNAAGAKYLIRARFSQYKVMTWAEYRSPEGLVRFSKGKWSKPVTEEPIMFLDIAPKERHLILPDRLSREINSRILTYLGPEIFIRSLSLEEFKTCYAELAKIKPNRGTGASN
jgi:hypothetical protein